MQDKESSLPEDWFNKGDDDKQAVGNFLERYPFFGGELSREEIENAYHESLKLIEIIDELYRQIRE